MKALILGFGKIGKAVAYCMHKIGYGVYVADNSPLGDYQDHFHMIFVETDLSKPDKVKELFSERFDVVISCLPYFLNTKVAQIVSEQNVAYCDLGGHVGTSKAINQLKTDVFTDLGLAPGWINIEAERLYHKLSEKCVVTDVNMFVGGLPQVRKCNPFEYKQSWSFDGLWNEYVDDCEILKDGKIVTVPGMSGYAKFGFWYDLPLESFYTSGGAAHTLNTMKERGVINCDYNTLRYEGHRELFLTLKDYMSKKEIEKLIPSNDNDDVVYMCVTAKGKYYKDAYTDTFQQIIYAKEKYSAMQQATAVPIAAVAHQMAARKLGRPWKYEDINYDQFLRNSTLLLEIF